MELEPGTRNNRVFGLQLGNPAQSTVLLCAIAGWLDARRAFRAFVSRRRSRYTARHCGSRSRRTSVGRPPASASPAAPLVYPTSASTSYTSPSFCPRQVMIACTWLARHGLPDGRRSVPVQGMLGAARGGQGFCMSSLPTRHFGAAN